MNVLDAQEFNQAVGLAQAGQRPQAYQRLSMLVQNNRNDSNLLLWLTFTAPDLATSRLYLSQLARHDPANPSLPAAQNWLKQEEAKQVNPLSEDLLLASYYSGEVKDKRLEQVQTVQRQLQEEPLQPQMPNYQEVTPLVDQTVKDPEAEEVMAEEDPNYASTGSGRGWQRKLIMILLGVFVVVLAVSVLLFVVFKVNDPNRDTEPERDRVLAENLPVYPGLERVVFSPDDRATINNYIRADLNKKLGQGSNVTRLLFETYRAPKTALLTPSVTPAPASTFDHQAVFNFYNLNLRRSNWLETTSSTVNEPAYYQSVKNIYLGARSTGYNYLDFSKEGINTLPYGINPKDEAVMLVFTQAKYGQVTP